MTIIVTIPMEPASELFPNRRHRRGGLYPGIHAAQESREVAKFAALEARQLADTISGPVHIAIHAAYGYRRQKPDLDATISACKPMLDGLVEAGLMYDDDQVVRITAEHEKLKSSRKQPAVGWTRITVSPVEEDAS